MTTIYKYPFEINDRVAIGLPDGAEILSVQSQSGTPCLWARVDPSRPVGLRYFRVFGTGHPIPGEADLGHVATFQDGPFVWHMFEDRGP